MDQYQLQQRSTNKKKIHRKRHVSILIMIFWAVILTLNTWAQSLERLLDFQSLHFIWISAPNLLSFFNFNDIGSFHEEDFLVVKLGHFAGFAIMDLLIFNVMRNHKAAVCISIVFAFLTEFLQLFFGRDGRLYDLMIDSLGIISVYTLLQLNNSLKEK
jgi:hypothetical protein